MKDKRRASSAHSRNASERGPKGGRYWLFGAHPCLAALQNEAREIHRALVSAQGAREFQRWLDRRRVLTSVVDGKEIAQGLPPGAVHQGIALQVSPLPADDLSSLYHAADDAVVLALDQVTDPHNVGAILRSAAAFDVTAVVTTSDHAAAETGTLAKAASGALELVPVVEVTNLADALQKLKNQGYWIAGLDGEAERTMAQERLTGKRVLVLGAEGKGLRQLTRRHCDFLVKLPISPRMESLNVSNAAAIALYELRRA